MLDEFRSTSITWDKATRRIYSPITANASDSNGRKLNIQVVNSGQVENLTGATLHLYWETKDKAHDGLDAFDASDISKGEFEIFYTTGMLSNVGELNATLVLVDSTGKVVSDWFKITVTRGINEGAIESENSFSSLTQALIDISNLEQNYAPRLNDLTAQLQHTEEQLVGVDTKKKLSKGLISFTWDNSFADHYNNMFPIFKARNLPFALSPVSDSLARFQNSTSYYTYEQLKEMIKYGAEIITHGTVGETLGAGKNMDYIEWEIYECKRFFSELGAKVNGFCVISSAAHASYLPIIKRHYEFAYTEQWDNKAIEDSVIDDSSNLYTMGRKSIGTVYSAGGIQAIKNLIDYADASKKWLNFYNHRLGSNTSDSIPLEVMEEILDYIATKNIDIVNPSEAVTRLNTKMVVGENINKLTEEMNLRIAKQQRNLLDNPNDMKKWNVGDKTTTNVIEEYVNFDGYNALKLTFDSTDNTNKYFNVRLLDAPISLPDLAGPLTSSIEITSDSNDAEIEIYIRGKSGSFATIFKTLPITKGTNTYEASTLTPPSAYKFNRVDLSFKITRKTATPIVLEIKKPKLEFSRERTKWEDYVTNKEYFEATANNLAVNFPSGSHNIMWNTVKAIQGGNYADGVYTVFRGGIYSVQATLTLALRDGQRGLMQILVNGVVVRGFDARQYTTNIMSYSILSNLTLKAGDKVVIRFTHNDGQGVIMTLNEPYNFMSIVRID